MQIMTPELGRRVGDFRLAPKHEVPSLQAFDKQATRSPFGQPVYDLYGRQNVTNKMNNLPPVERIRVGPGLGVAPDVPATGGFQQFFRVLPNNINEERLTTIEGRPGPASAFIKNGGTVIGDITHQAKDTKAWNRPPAQNRGEGQGGALTGPEGRPDFIRSKRTTIRQETGSREDTLSSGPGKYHVSQPYATGGAYTDTSLTRSSDNRGNADRAGAPGRMNVRMDAVNQTGAATNLRAETTPFPVAAPDGGRFQNYQRAEFDQLNEKKGTLNPRATAEFLDVAIQQLEKNPLAQRPLAT
jgi:hypothetical protein